MNFSRHFRPSCIVPENMLLGDTLSSIIYFLWSSYGWLKKKKKTFTFLCETKSCLFLNGWVKNSITLLLFVPNHNHLTCLILLKYPMSISQHFIVFILTILLIKKRLDDAVEKQIPLYYCPKATVTRMEGGEEIKARKATKGAPELFQESAGLVNGKKHFRIHLHHCDVASDLSSKSLAG